MKVSCFAASAALLLPLFCACSHAPEADSIPDLDSSQPSSVSGTASAAISSMGPSSLWLSPTLEAIVSGGADDIQWPDGLAVRLRLSETEEITQLELEYDRLAVLDTPEEFAEAGLDFDHSPPVKTSEYQQKKEAWYIKHSLERVEILDRLEQLRMEHTETVLADTFRGLWPVDELLGERYIPPDRYNNARLDLVLTSEEIQQLYRSGDVETMLAEIDIEEVRGSLKASDIKSGEPDEFNYAAWSLFAFDD